MSLTLVNYIKEVKYLSCDGTSSGSITNSIAYSNVYIWVTSVEGAKSLQVTVQIYSDSAKTSLLDRKSYNFIPDYTDSGKNYIKQAYEYLKTLTDYKDATNVLETGQTV